jgi:hypothetical protein
MLRPTTTRAVIASTRIAADPRALTRTLRGRSGHCWHDHSEALDWRDAIRVGSAGYISSRGSPLVDGVTVIEVSGASGVPARLWQVRTTYGLSVLQLRDDGVRVVLRPRWLGRVWVWLLLLPRRDELAPDAGWAVTWEGIRHVMATDRSFVLYPRVGRACFFMVRKRSSLEPVMRELNRRGIQVKRANSNFLRSLFI